MVGYIVRRLLQSIPTVFLISLVLFFGMQAMPGGPLAAFAFNGHMSLAAQEAVIKRWGLDEPVYIQYFKWLTSMLRGDWQTSFMLHVPVRDAIASHLPATVFLMGFSYIVQELVALPAGIYAALRRYSAFDQFLTFMSYVLYSMPTFWLGLILMMVFAVFVPIFPVGGIVDINTIGAGFLTAEYNQWFAQHPIDGILDLLHHLVLPAITIAAVGIAGDSRFMRASMLDTVHQDYVRTARAKGLPERVVVLKHALRNALLPIITNIALTLPTLFSGAVVTEAIYSWPGMGQLYFQALSYSDYPLMMGVFFVAGVLVVFFNLLADIAYAFIDPRISYA